MTRKPDYVKNRPFYTEDPAETVILPETTITIYANSENLISSSFPYSFEVGQTYVITFDGVDTEYIAYELQGIVIIGDNYSSVVGGSGYIVMANNSGAIVLNTMDSSLEGSHTIAIKICTKEIVKVDEKYLPESAFTDAEWSKISNKIVDYKQQSLLLSVSGEPITIRGGSNYSNNRINNNLKFEDGMVYEINGSIVLYNTKGGNSCTLDINGSYICSHGCVSLGSCHDNYFNKYIKVELYSSSPDDNHYNYGKLATKTTISGIEYTFDIDIEVTGEAKPLPDICIGENIQRVGADVVIQSSTPDSTKKFKITVDDRGTLSATEVT